MFTQVLRKNGARGWIEQDPVRVSTPVQFHGPLLVPKRDLAFHLRAQRTAFRRPDVRQQRRVLVSGNSTAKPTPRTRGAV